jgi:hypothetical protein
MNNLIRYQSHSIYVRKLSVIFFVVFFTCCSSLVIAQDKKPIKTRISLECYQTGNDQLIVLADLKARPERSYVSLPESEAKIYALSDSSDVLLGTGISNSKGRVKYIVDLKNSSLARSDGMYGIKVTYAGDEAYDSADKSVEFAPARLEMKVTEESDSIKNLSVQLVSKDTAATLSDVAISLQIPRMFSNLTVAKAMTDDKGMVEFTFPNDMPGDEEGMLDIVVKAVDTDNFASIENKMTKNWGIPVHEIIKEDARELWSPNAPLWMVLTFALLMVLVWGHFMVVVYKLFQIRKEGREMSLEGN